MGIFIGELDGVIISSLCVVKFDDNLAFLGYYVVEKRFRGKGYGLAIFKAGMASLSKSHNCGLNAMLDTVQMYEKCGFQRAWTNRKIKFVISSTSSLLNDFNLPSILVQTATQVNFSDLFAYTLEVFGAPLGTYLKKLLEAPNTMSFAATSEGAIVGFVSARRAIRKGRDWKVVPLYADNIHIAKTLLKHVFSTLVNTSSLTDVVSMDVAYDFNQEANALWKELNGSFYIDCVQMFSKGIPDIPKHKSYGVLLID